VVSGRVSAARIDGSAAEAHASSRRRTVLRRVANVIALVRGRERVAGADELVVRVRRERWLTEENVTRHKASTGGRAR